MSATTSPDLAASRSQSILDTLEAAGNWCSGESLSRQLGISRAAVAKHVAGLRRKGHAIEAATRRGYRLLVRSEPLDENQIAELLRPISLVSRVVCLDSTGSTNQEAARMAMAGACEGHLVLAETQTMGRGRKGRDWFSSPRSLQCSLILGPEREPARLTRLGVAAMAQAISTLTGLEARFKEPNDVLLRGRKVGGVLVETGYRGSEPDWTVIGIGCNVNALSREFPEPLRNQVTSLLIETGVPQNRTALLAQVLGHLERLYREELR